MRKHYSFQMKHPTETSHHKSRNGCLRCKAKKTKCDERKPACARCEERGVQCPGYALNVRWSQKHQLQGARPRLDKSRNGASPESNPSLRLNQSTSYSSFSKVYEVATHDRTASPGQVQELEPNTGTAGQCDFSLVSEAPILQGELFELDQAGDGLLLGEEPVSLFFPSWESGVNASPWGYQGEVSTPSFNFDEVSAGEQHVDDRIDVSAIRGGSVETYHMFRSPPRPAEPSRLVQVLTPTGNRCYQIPPRDLETLPATLSNYFFREVITLYCSWDSSSNIMRNILETMWQTSGALHHTVLSMAAACLSESFPQLSSVAKAEYHKALEYIEDGNRPSESQVDRLLAYMLLGHTASWLSPKNLATSMFRESYKMLKDNVADSGESRDISFFSDTMEYWAMLLVYLTESHQLGDYQRDAVAGPVDPNSIIEAHPYSGTSRETIRLMTDIGILIFKYRKDMSNITFITEKDLDLFRTALREARRLERSLLAYVAPDPSRVIDPGDPQTPLDHLQRIDEAYRCTGLLQIYRLFPDLLNERYAPWDKEQILRPPPSTYTPTEGEKDIWLTKLSLHILCILREIPFESRTRSVQPFILVALSSELRRGSQHHQSSTSGLEDPQWLNINDDSIEVIQARKFVSSRLTADTHILPLHKIRVIFELINCIWAALDAGDRNVYWVDVARQKNLGTMMG